MNNLKESQKQEALRRMDALGLGFKHSKEVFKESEKLTLVPMDLKDVNFSVILDENDECCKKAREWEKETGNLIYYIIRNRLSFGICYTYLYVSKYQEDWEMDFSDVKEASYKDDNGIPVKTPIAYVYNEADDTCSEYGSVGIVLFGDCLLRVA